MVLYVDYFCVEFSGEIADVAAHSSLDRERIGWHLVEVRCIDQPLEHGNIDAGIKRIFLVSVSRSE